MASTIKIKNGTSGAPSSLVQGELAINVSEGKLFYGSAGGTAVSSSFTFTDITSSGTISASGMIQTAGAISSSTGITASDAFFSTHVTASGNIKAAGGMICDNINITDIDDGLYFNGTQTFFIDASNNVNLGVDSNAAVDLELYGHNHTYTAGGSITLDAGGDINLDAAGDQVYFKDAGTTKLTIDTSAGHITASGNISSSGGNITANFPDTNDDATHYPLVVTSQNSVVETQNSLSVNPSTNNVTFDARKIAISSGTDGKYKGADVVYFGGTTSKTTGAIYHYKSDGTWELADADAASTSDGLLAVALGAASDTNGMLLRGMVTLDHDPGAVGDVLYLSTTAGDATSTAPSGNGDIVRVIGYCLHASAGNIWFNPDNTFVEVNA